MNQQSQHGNATSPAVRTMTALTARVRGEYTEAPELQLTVEQAARFLGLERSTCERVFRDLEHAGYLSRRADGRYQRAHDV